VVFFPLAFRDVSVWVRLLLLLLLGNAEDPVDAICTGSLGVMVPSGVVGLRLYRGRWCVGDDGHGASLLLLLLLSRAARRLLLLLLLLLMVNMLSLLGGLVPDDSATHRQGPDCIKGNGQKTSGD
jgi:hypothetical protein